MFLRISTWSRKANPDKRERLAHNNYYEQQIWIITQIQAYAAMYESKLNSVKHWSIYHVFTACKIKLIIIFDSMFSVCERLGAHSLKHNYHWANKDGLLFRVKLRGWFLIRYVGKPRSQFRLRWRDFSVRVEYWWHWAR